jgi:hypothetical protein
MKDCLLNVEKLKMNFCKNPEYPGWFMDVSDFGNSWKHFNE